MNWQLTNCDAAEAISNLLRMSNARSKLSVYFAMATKCYAWFDPTRNYSHLVTLEESTVAVSLSLCFTLFPVILFSAILPCTNKIFSVDVLFSSALS